MKQGKAEEGKAIKEAQAQAERCDTAKDKGPKKEREAYCARRPDRPKDSRVTWRKEAGARQQQAFHIFPQNSLL